MTAEPQRPLAPAPLPDEVVALQPASCSTRAPGLEESVALQPASHSARAPLPEAFVALEAAIRSALAAAGQADAWDASTRAAVLAWTAKLRDRVSLVEGLVLTAEREAGTWALKGDRDLAAFAGRVSHEGRGAGFAAVGRAATLSAMPAVAEALAAGPLTTNHVTEITKAAAASPALAAHLATDEGQAQVVGMAHRLDGSQFGKQLARMSAGLDPAARQRSHDEQRATRYLHLAHTPGGTLLRGQLDAVAGHKLAKALDALTPRPAVDDERDHGQRQADALMVVVERALADRAGTAGVLAPVQALITFDESTWAALREPRRDQDAVPSAGSAADVVAALRGTAPVVDESGSAWPASEIARALCDCVLTRAVLASAGHPLDVGRDSRLFTRAHWLALYASGRRTCAVDGCEMPLGFTELHHMTWWGRDHGPTDPAHCAPECSFHHHEIHRLDLRITRRADGSFEHRHPDGRRYGGAPPPDADGPPGRLLELVADRR